MVSEIEIPKVQLPVYEQIEFLVRIAHDEFISQTRLGLDEEWRDWEDFMNLCILQVVTPEYQGEGHLV
jgi:hypothetical protein